MSTILFRKERLKKWEQDLHSDEKKNVKDVWILWVKIDHLCSLANGTETP